MSDAKSKALGKKKVVKMSQKEARSKGFGGFSFHETPEQQKLNRIGRKGTKRPEHGDWPQFKKA